jgi:hypothetical protein
VLVEKTPWGPGLTVSAMCAAIAAAGMFAFGAALAEINTWLSVILTAVAAAGVTPTVWAWRTVPVRRWVAYGVAVGASIGWFVSVVHTAVG